VKHQRGVVGADLATILAKRNQKPEVSTIISHHFLRSNLPHNLFFFRKVRTAQREAAVKKAKEEKKKKAEAAKKTAKPVGKSTQPKVSKQGAKGSKPRP